MAAKVQAHQLTVPATEEHLRIGSKNRNFRFNPDFVFQKANMTCLKLTGCILAY